MVGGSSLAGREKMLRNKILVKKMENQVICINGALIYLCLLKGCIYSVFLRCFKIVQVMM